MKLHWFILQKGNTESKAKLFKCIFYPIHLISHSSSYLNHCFQSCQYFELYSLVSGGFEYLLLNVLKKKKKTRKSCFVYPALPFFFHCILNSMEYVGTAEVCLFNFGENRKPLHHVSCRISPRDESLDMQLETCLSTQTWSGNIFQLAVKRVALISWILVHVFPRGWESPLRYVRETRNCEGTIERCSEKPNELNEWVQGPFRSTLLMQMNDDICWQWKNHLLMSAKWAVLGKREQFGDSRASGDGDSCWITHCTALFVGPPSIYCLWQQNLCLIC